MRTAAKFAVGSLSAQETLELLCLAALLVRWHRVVGACDGDLEQARGVWRMIGGAELGLEDAIELEEGLVEQ